MNSGLLDSVSRETMDLLKSFEALVLKWGTAINLVSRSDLPKLWERHILDSVQIHHAAPMGGHWVDLGSGGGFPGVVAAILSKGTEPAQNFTFIESDQRKSVFLRTAVRELGLNAKVVTQRIEDAAPINADILTARALTDLTDLLGHAKMHLIQTGVALFPKGEKWRTELKAAQEIWRFNYEALPSRTNDAAVILKIKDIERV